jgi:two-component system sensor histidine kinase/response regulator
MDFLVRQPYMVHNMRLLLVEDDEDDYVLTQGLLEDIIAGEYELTWASTPEDARRHFINNAHDLCLMDYRLGAEDGLSLLREAPQLGFKGPIIMLTGQDNKQLDREALNAGAEDYLVKSQLNPAGLARTIRYALTRREMEKERVERLRAETENRSKSEFLAHLSHELRTPLTAILGYTDLLLSTEANPDKNHLHIIKRNGRHLLSLLNDVLDLSKIEAGKLEIDLMDVNLHDFVNEIFSLISVNAQDKNLRLNISAPSPLPIKIKTDPTRLRQILLNLLGNAIKFTPAGKVSLEIKEALFDHQSYLQFAITDTGLGISPEDINKLFKPFSQVGNRAGLQQQPGTGLGLAISCQLAQRLGGDITVVSNLGMGSTFTVNIDPGPLHQVERRELQPTEKMDTTKINKAINFKGHVLVTDDLPDIRLLIGHLITSFGGRIGYATNGQEALHLVEQKIKEGDPFDLLIMDSQMPVMDGLSATRHLRARGYTKPILALTAASLQGERERCLEAGCDDYLSKPIDAETLLTRIQTLLRRENKASQQIPEKASTAHISPVTHAAIKRPILLVEDNRDAREATALLLNHLGWEVITAKDGQDALEAIRQVRPVAALLDINLPDMNGYELAIRLRKAGLKSARFIALSGQQPDHLKAAESGFDDHLIKPIDLASLHLMLNSIK